MARPTKDKKQNTVLPPIRCTVDEKQQIQIKAIAVGMNLSQYVRNMALSGKIIIQQSFVEFTYLEQLKKIGVNLNQQTKKFNATGETPQQLNSIWNKLETVLNQLTPPNK